ncbi:hypothetical protein CPB83DRAFT_755476 [Crepidotus variabilis]|uniref:Endoplasmic reticulum junction formation protein lunapark n=1 Tax=Crepidotus variabilis TaxID=179855 RepID=A0A9P6EU14_9AGAR|nr:hypothetical protein CPB83DRAFT_755476 [Crepidotus variabilis]
MSFIKRLFEKKKYEDYETVLSNLATDIQKRQVHLSEIRLRERRSTLLVTLYTLAAWVAYGSIWYLNALPGTYVQNPALEKTIKGIPVILGPIIILFIRRIVQIWYSRKGDAEEKALKELMKQRREKVDEIKKKTNYYSTRDLLQKYDEAAPASSTPLRQRFPAGQAPPVTPQRPPVAIPNNGNLQTPPSAALQAHLSRKITVIVFYLSTYSCFLNEASTPTYPLGPPRKQWYDKVADAILGDDDAGAASPSSRYALICEKCFTHNGLVKESMWEDAQYVCPKCGHFNASTRSKRERGRQSASPSASANSSPAHPSALATPSNSRHSQRSPPSPATPNADLPTVDADDSMSMEVDSVTGKSARS